MSGAGESGLAFATLCREYKASKTDITYWMAKKRPNVLRGSSPPARRRQLRSQASRQEVWNSLPEEGGPIALSQIVARADKFGLSRSMVYSILLEYQRDGLCIELYTKGRENRRIAWWARVTSSQRVDWFITAERGTSAAPIDTSKGRGNPLQIVNIRIPEDEKTTFDGEYNFEGQRWVRCFIQHPDQLKWDEAIVIDFLMKNGFSREQALELKDPFVGKVKETRRHRQILGRKKDGWHG